MSIVTRIKTAGRTAQIVAGALALGALTACATPGFNADVSRFSLMPVPQGQTDAGTFHVGMVNGTRVWLIYRPDLDWLKSPDAALTLTFARQVAETHPGERHLVFAPARYVSQRLLDAEGLAVEFVPLPFALYRVERV